MVSEDSHDLWMLTLEPPSGHEPFLRVFRRGPCHTTHRRIVTVAKSQCMSDEYRSDTPGFPAYSRLRTASSPMRGAAPPACLGDSYLRTLIVRAAVYRRFGSELRSEELTPPLNVPAPGRRQSVYIVLRLRTDLCF